MIDKIEIRDNHIFCTSKIKKPNTKVLVMSHGSGGISDIDLHFAGIANSNGFEVAIIDHFTPRQIDLQSWKDLNIRPTFEEREQDIIDIKNRYNADKIFGISAGGTAAISTAFMFNGCFTVYPALACIDNKMSHSSDVTIVTGKNDNWCPIEQARKYAEFTGSTLIELDAEHGFLNPRQNRFMQDVYSLRKIDLPIPTRTTYDQLNYKEKGVTLKYNKKAREKTEKLFENWIKK